MNAQPTNFGIDLLFFQIVRKHRLSVSNPHQIEFGSIFILLKAKQFVEFLTNWNIQRKRNCLFSFQIFCDFLRTSLHVICVICCNRKTINFRSSFSPLIFFQLNEIAVYYIVVWRNGIRWGNLLLDPDPFSDIEVTAIELIYLHKIESMIDWNVFNVAQLYWSIFALFISIFFKKFSTCPTLNLQNKFIMGKTHQYRMFNVLNCFSRIPLSDEKDSNLVLIILFPQLCSGGKW